MKRLHVNLAVTDLDASVRFYTSLFAASPTVHKADYARWMLDDPRVNFAISTHGERKGVDHLGIQVEDESELSEVYARLRTAAAPVFDQGETVCCYARSEKQWILDPEGLAWETFLTRGESPVYGTDDIAARHDGTCCVRDESEQSQTTVACCDPAAETTTACCQ